MLYFAVMIGMFSIFLVMIIGLVGYRRFVKREHVEVHYTPFDYITAQSGVEFHDEKEADDRENDKDNDNRPKR